MEAVLVAVRCRPLSAAEQEQGCINVLGAKNDVGCVSLTNPKGDLEPPKAFTYDQVYDEHTNQESVYEQAAFPLIDSVMEGFNCTIFAYGQTGAGKTYTMLGIPDDEERKGIIPRSFEHIFESIHVAGARSRFLIVVSYLEIYNEEIRDLLAGDGKRLELKEDPEKGVIVKDLCKKRCGDASEVKQHLLRGFDNQVQAATAMNVESSRSHSIFCVYVEREDNEEDKRLRAAKLNLVDLAGSERQAKTKVNESDRIKEATKINLSLSALGNVISALVDGTSSTHIPFRDSKLTRLLQDSLGGNTRTVMMANVGPADLNYDETLSTLRYANRAKNIKNKPVVNDDPKDAMLRELQSEVERLRNALQQYQLEKENTNKNRGQRPGAPDQPRKPRNRSKAHLSFETSSAGVADGSRGKESRNRGAAASGSRPAASAMREPTHEPNSQDADNDLLETIEDMPKDPSSCGALDDLLAEVNKIGTSQQEHEDDAMYHDWLDEKQKNSKLETENELMRQRLQAATDLHTEAKRRRKNELETRLAAEKDDHEDLDQQISNLEAQFVVGGTDDSAARKQEKWRVKIQKQRDEIEYQRRAVAEAEERALMVDHQYQSLQDEAKEKTEIIDKLRVKFRQSKCEIVDVQREIEESREELLEEIRESSKHLAMYKQIALAILPQREVKKIAARAKWDEGDQVWKLPAVSLRPTRVKLPSLGQPADDSSSSQSEYFEQSTPRDGVPREKVKKSQKSSSHRSNRERPMEASASSTFGLPMGDPDEADPMCPSGIGVDPETWADRSPRPDTSRERGNPRPSRDRMMATQSGRGGHVRLDPLGSVRARWGHA